MKSRGRKLLYDLVAVLLLLGLQALLLRWLLARNVVASILAVGEHTSRWTLALAGLFIVARFTVYFLLPGLVLARLAGLAFDLAQGRAAPAPPAARDSP